MFSATFNKGCRKLARKFLATDHVRVRIGRAGSAHQNVKQVVSRSMSLSHAVLTNLGDRLRRREQEELSL